MPYCPECATEYTEGASSCSDCGVPLVAALPEDVYAHESKEHTVLVFKADDEIEAQALTSLLEAEGISCSVRPDPHQPGYPVVVSTPAGVRIFVLEEDAEKARALVERFEESQNEPPE